MKEVVYQGKLYRFKAVLGHRYLAFQYGIPKRVSDKDYRILIQDPDFVELKDFPSVEKYGEGEVESIAVVLPAALGDLIQLHAVTKKFKKYTGNAVKVSVYTGKGYAAILKYSNVFDAVHVGCDGRDFDSDAVIYISPFIQLDHERLDFRIHRCELMWLRLTGKRNLPTPLDFSIPIGEVEMRRAEDEIHRFGGSRIVVVQLVGSTEIKSFQPEMVDVVCSTIKDLGWNPVVLHHHRIGSVAPFYSAPTPLDALAFVSLCEAMICTDSGGLWLAHAASKPTLAFLGATNPEARTSLHPAYCKSVELNKWIKCPSCFESMRACDGKISCIREANPRKIRNEVMEFLYSIEGDL